jgi:hypothetical protein
MLKFRAARAMVSRGSRCVRNVHVSKTLFSEFMQPQAVDYSRGQAVYRVFMSEKLCSVCLCSRRL